MQNVHVLTTFNVLQSLIARALFLHMHCSHSVACSLVACALFRIPLL